jgi:tetratricopeptide (TPR) repeat protein
VIEPSPALLKEYQMKKRRKGRLDQTPEMLTTLSNSLIDGE